MGDMWIVTFEDVLLTMELAKKHGKKKGESYEEEFLTIMKIKQIKPVCSTDKNMDELKDEFTKKGYNVGDLTDLINKLKKSEGDNNGKSK